MIDGEVFLIISFFFYTALSVTGFWWGISPDHLYIEWQLLYIILVRIFVLQLTSISSIFMHPVLILNIFYVFI